MRERSEIIVDLDNTVYDWITVMSNWLEYHGVAAPMDQYHSWDVWDDWGIPKGMFDRLWRLGVEEDVVYRQGPIVEGAREWLWYLSDNEYHITLATNRLSKFGLYSKVAENTVAWLQDAGIPYRSLLFTGNKRIQGAHYGIDDSPVYIKQMEEAGIDAYLFDAPHNKGAEGQRVYSWASFVDRVMGEPQYDR